MTDPNRLHTDPCWACGVVHNPSEDCPKYDGCFLSSFSNTRCQGRLIRAHLLPRSLLKREFGKTEGKKLAEDPRSFVWACGGVMGNSGHHGAFDTARTLRVPRWALPAGVERMAADLDLLWYLEREFGPLEAAA